MLLKSPGQLFPKWPSCFRMSRGRWCSLGQGGDAVPFSAHRLWKYVVFTLSYSWGGSTLIAWIKWRRGGRFLHRKLTIFPFEIENICGETTQWSHFSSYCHPRTVVVTQRALPSVILNHGVCPELIICFSHSSLTHFFGGLLRGWNEERQLHQCPAHGEV